MMVAVRLGFGVWNDRRAVTAIEYAIMGGLLAVAVSLAMVSLTGGISTAFGVAARAFPGQ